MLTSVEVGQPPAVVAVELDRSHTAIVGQARERWYPWVGRGVTAAVVCAVLAIAMAIFAGLFSTLQRRAARRTDSAPQAGAPTQRAAAVKRSSAPADSNLPAYMRPGFQDEVEARREAETALEAAEKERVQLLERLRRTEAELEEARRQLAEREPGHALPAR
jgi:hypothetical protein